MYSYDGKAAYYIIPDFSDMWSLRNHCKRWFGTQETFLIIINFENSSAAYNCFRNVIDVSGFVDEKSSKEQHLLETEIFWNINKIYFALSLWALAVLKHCRIQPVLR